MFKLYHAANKELQVDNGNLYNANKELQVKIEKSEKERIRMEAEARDSGDQLREMAEKVFQLLERLKLAELGKSKGLIMYPIFSDVELDFPNEC